MHKYIYKQHVADNLMKYNRAKLFLQNVLIVINY